MNFSFDVLESQLLNTSNASIEIDYDPDFLELESIIAPKAEQQYGDTIIPAAPIDWSRALTKACELLGKSKDFRLCCIITRALTNKYGIKGTLKGIESISTMIDNHWDGSFPEINFDGEIDLLPRANAISELNSFSGLVGELRHTELSLGAAGKISLGKIERVLNGRSDNEDFSRDQLLNVFRDESNKDNADIAALNQLQLKLNALEKNLIALFGNDYSPDFSQLKHLIVSSNPVFGQRERTEQTSLADNDSTSAITTIQNSSRIVNTNIQSRSDAIEWLDRVCDFLTESDPANPAPLLIKRARNMIGQDFYTILGQLAPDAVSQAEQITGSQT